jgi:hypothetical protein
MEPELVRRALKLGLFSLALLALLVAVTAAGVLHSHDLVSGRLCPVCQLAHMPILDPGVPTLIPSLALVAWHTPTKLISADLDPWSHDHPSRAPPA